MPFGLTAAPRVFTKLLVALVAYLHCRGVALDDILNQVTFQAEGPDGSGLDYDWSEEH